MLTKRTATIAIFGAALAKMAQADEPPKPSEPMKSAPVPPIDWRDAVSRPAVWSVNLDQMTRLDVYLGGKKVTASAAEIFDALNGEAP